MFIESEPTGLLSSRGAKYFTSPPKSARCAPPELGGSFEQHLYKHFAALRLGRELWQELQRHQW